MQPTSPKPVILLMPANDLPAAPAAERARLRTRERRMRGPTWAQSAGDDAKSA